MEIFLYLYMSLTVVVTLFVVAYYTIKKCRRKPVPIKVDNSTHETSNVVIQPRRSIQSSNRLIHIDETRPTETDDRFNNAALRRNSKVRIRTHLKEQ